MAQDEASKLLFPKEHGSWAVLIAPVTVGFAAARGGSLDAMVLFSCAALGAFLARAPIQSLVFSKTDARAWPTLAVSGALALAGILPLLLVYGRWGLLKFAIPAAGMLALDLYIQGARRSFSVFSELSGILILCLGAPAAYYAARGTLGFDAWIAWGLSALYFTGPIFYVKTAALQHRSAAAGAANPELSRMSLISLCYHGAALSAVAAAAFVGAAPVAAPLPFAVALVKAWVRGSSPPARVDFQRLGYQEVGYSAFFVIVLSASYLLRR